MIEDDFDEMDTELDTVRDLIRSEGVRSAYAALKSVCDDEKAPAPAKATAGVALLRAAGLFERSETESQKKEPHEMTRAELDAHIRKLERQQHALKRRPRRDDEPPESVFG